MLAEIEARGEAAVRDYALKLDKWSGDIVVTSGGDRAPHRATCPRRQGATSTSRPARSAASPRRSATAIQRFRRRAAAGTDRRSEARALQRGRLLRPDRPLRAHRLGLHVGGDREGRGRADRGRLLDALSRRGHSPLRPLRDEGRRRGRGHDAGRGAGDRRDGLRPVHGQAGRHHRRARQQVRGRGQAHAVRRVSASMSSPGPSEVGDHRRRDGGSGDRRLRPRRPGRARPREPGLALHDLARNSPTR